MNRGGRSGRFHTQFLQVFRPKSQGFDAEKNCVSVPNGCSVDDLSREGRRQSDAWRGRIGGAIRLARERRRLTQADLANLVGVDIATISKTELGKTVPDFAALETIADILAVSLDGLVGRDTTLLTQREDGVERESLGPWARIDRDDRTPARIDAARALPVARFLVHLERAQRHRRRRPAAEVRVGIPAGSLEDRVKLAGRERRRVNALADVLACENVLRADLDRHGRNG